MAKNKLRRRKPGRGSFGIFLRDLMHKMKIAAAIEHKSVKQLLIDLSRTHLEDMEKKGLLPKGKNWRQEDAVSLIAFLT